MIKKISKKIKVYIFGIDYSDLNKKRGFCRKIYKARAISIKKLYGPNARF